jgi:hypothetical protein
MIVQCGTIYNFHYFDAARLGNITKMEILNEVSEQLDMVELNSINKLVIMRIADYRPKNLTLHFFLYAPACRPQYRVSMATFIALFRFANWLYHSIQFNVIYFKCSFTKLIVPKAGNRTLSTMPAREIWVMAWLSHSCSQSVGLIAVTVTTVSVVFCIVQV